MLPANLLLSSLLLVSSAAALSPLLNPWHARPHIPYVDEPDDTVSVFHVSTHQQISSYKETYYFDQLIDHNNPKLGTFKQRYWHNYEFYEPGGTIVLGTPGEVNAEGFTGYLTNLTINGMIAQATDGATIIIEHRFFGESNPYPDLSVESLRVHTIQQAIDDLEYFAKNVKLPMPNGDKVTPDKAPWILIGGSYPGALVSYVMKNKPGLFFAGYSSSGVVQAIGHFWGYFEPIREYMPKNCSSDVQAVIKYIDETFDSGNATAIHDMKAIFGLEDIVHADDFGAASVDKGKSAPASGWGLNHALKAWGAYWKNSFYSLACGNSSAEACFGTHDPKSSQWNNTELSDGRSWKWMTCNQFGFFPVGASEGHPTIVSRHLTPEYSERGCQYDFPGAFQGLRKSSLLNALAVNVAFGGWNVTTDRLIFANGERDPWREATVAVHGGSFPKMALQPHLVSDGFHCSDMLASEGSSNAVREVQVAAVDYMTKWHAEWKKKQSA